MGADDRNPLERAQAGSNWIDELLALFWSVDEVVQLGAESALPPTVFAAYQAAEKARREL